jgi:DNA (cytosine-5)-methyltransferase 1
LNAIDMFCGAGGLSTGLSEAGIKVVFALDNYKDALKTYKYNHPKAEVIDIDLRSIPLAFKEWVGKIDIVAGGPPCQPFSVAGHQRAAADERDCIPHFISAVATLKPKAFIMENVPGLTTPRHREYLDDVVEKLSDLGYFVTKPQILNAADYGVPQFRKRLFIVGMVNRYFIYPEPTHGPNRPNHYVTSRCALKLAQPDKPNTAIVTYAKKPIMRPSPYDGMLVNGQGRPINLDEPSQTIPATAGGNRTHIIDEEGVFADYHEYLVNGGVPRKGKIEGVRRLTVSESACLQGFPENYVFLGKQSSRYRQVGNAVPPKLAAAVARQVIALLSVEGEGENAAFEKRASLHSQAATYQRPLPLG